MKNKETKTITPRPGFEIINGKEVMRVSISNFENWKESVRINNIYLEEEQKKKGEVLERELSRMEQRKRQIICEIQKPITLETPSKEKYQRFFEESKKEVEENEDEIWTGGDKPNFD